MYLRIDPAVEGTDGFGIDLIAVELESGNREGQSLRDISPYSDNLSLEIVGIRYEGGGRFPDDRNSGECPGRWDLDPSIGLEYYPIFRGKAGCRTENLFLTELVVDIHRPIGIFRAHLVDGGDIEGILHRYLQIHRADIDRILAVEHTGFLLCKDDVARYRLDSELRCYRHVGLRDREIEYEGKEGEGSDESYDEEKYVGIPSDLLVLVYLGLFLGEKYEP